MKPPWNHHKTMIIPHVNDHYIAAWILLNHAEFCSAWIIPFPINFSKIPMKSPVKNLNKIPFNHIESSFFPVKSQSNPTIKPQNTEVVNGVPVAFLTVSSVALKLRDLMEWSCLGSLRFCSGLSWGAGDSSKLVDFKWDLSNKLEYWLFQTLV